MNEGTEPAFKDATWPDLAGSNENEMIRRASLFAGRAHASIGRRRKYTNEPYIDHPVAVAELVRSVPHSAEMIMAAYLHDTVEDTPITLADIDREFGSTVCNYVGMLTDVSRPDDGNRQQRKEIDRQHTARAQPAAKTIKLADIIDNARSITEHDPEFAATYLVEQEALMDVLIEGDKSLYLIALHELVRAVAALDGKSKDMYLAKRALYYKAWASK